MKALKRLEYFWYLLAATLITAFMTENMNVSSWLTAPFGALASFGINTVLNFDRNSKSMT